ncbi:porin [Vibrio vulnificus]|uniref:porin n=1 Tax=Vibrio vulnificus TaxID=672 RepID=UPI0019D45D51|nr:porin [Vibrio vulnificus]MBN8132159.1 porin [Vibrio vulnificus]MBN8159481.1 porin [Vibrio vulnificus]
MDKMFKRTLLGAAVASLAATGSANAAVQLAGDAVQFYGQAAGYITVADSGDTTVVATTIESRIGFRGVVEFEDFSPKFVWQIEGGNADNGGFNPNEGWNHVNNGQLGARDTYLGFDFGKGGRFTYGRQLVAAYNYVDWPHSNPGLGNVFDWNNDIGAGYQDRASNNLRYDSANFGGFSFQATLSGMESDIDGLVSSVGASYGNDVFNIHGGVYSRGEYGTGADLKYANSYGILGGSLYLGSLTLTAAYKAMEADSATGTLKQNALSTTAQYVIDGKWVLKAGYAATDNATGDSKSSDTAVTARLGYILPSAYLYLDSRNYKMNEASDWTKAILAGVEYYF